MDPSTQLQISTQANDGGMMGPMSANPSPNSRMNAGGAFAQPATKNHRIIVTGQQQNVVGGQPFQHPMSRPVSVQIPSRQAQMQQRIGQSPFSPQPQTPQSPHDQFPLSPANGMDQFSRPPSECSQPDPYLNVNSLLNLYYFLCAKHTATHRYNTFQIHSRHN